MRLRFPPFAVAVALVSAQLAVVAKSRIARQSDGHPDLTGFWTDDSFTPLERPAELGSKAGFTREEARSLFQAAPRSNEWPGEGRHPLRRCAVAGGNVREAAEPADVDRVRSPPPPRPA